PFLKSFTCRSEIISPLSIYLSIARRFHRSALQAAKLAQRACCAPVAQSRSTVGRDSIGPGGSEELTGSRKSTPIWTLPRPVSATAPRRARVQPQPPAAAGRASTICCARSAAQPPASGHRHTRYRAHRAYDDRLGRAHV